MAESYISYSILGCIIVGLNLVLFLPLMTYFGFVFYKRSKNRIKEDNETFFNRRHPSTIYVTIAFCIFFVAIERPISFLIYQMNIIDLPFEYGDENDPFQFFAYALGAYGIYFTFLQRFWMVFYSYKHAVAQAKLVWKRQLNPDYNENDNFFFANQELLGSFRQTSPCLVVCWMITVILLPIASLAIPFDIATFCLLTPPFLVISYIAYRISPITDQYFIRDELVLCIIIMGVSLFLHLVIFLCVGLTVKNVQLQIYLGSFVSCIQYTLLCYVCTLWVLKKNDFNHVIRPKMKHVIDDSSKELSKTNSFIGQLTPSLFLSASTNSEMEPVGIRKRKLYNLLRTKHGFNLFMMHLTVELSVENLLFICELIQFKRALCKQHLNGKIHGWMEELPYEFIPKCEAISKYPGDYLSQIHLIYNKYVKWESALELNISARRRKRILQQFDVEKQDGKIDENLMAKGWRELSMFYDECAIEIWKLMNDSFGRIIETDAYKTWHNQLPKKMDIIKGDEATN